MLPPSRITSRRCVDVRERVALEVPNGNESHAQGLGMSI